MDLISSLNIFASGSATLSFGNPMLVLKSSKFYKRLYSCSSVVDSEASYLTKHIDSFLSNSPHSSTKVFDSLSFKDPFLWNSIIKAYFSNGNYVQAVELFSKMPFFGNLPNQFTIPMVVSACAELGLLCFGMNVHAFASKLNLFCGNSAVGASFVYMYSKCGVVDDASLVFDEIAMKDVVAWTAIVIGYVQNGESDSGLQCLREMHRLGGYGERPNFRTLEGGFQACGNLSALTDGRCLHGFALKSGIVSSHIVQSAVLSMYSKCGSIEDARVSFCEVVNKDLFSWTSFIGVHAKLGYVCECFQIFLKMQANGVYPDGMAISCLISGFGHNQEKDCWNLMVVGYEKAGLEMNCIKLFREMRHKGIEADFNSVISVISSCSDWERSVLVDLYIAI
ncbi:Pentatricopeptide repeat-containing protein, mitochondrial [Sesamum angolense]|uniref:Pentatricopeptide repeat-containing protein, mitochondrial n=1 Tax=Sesamum angolense TaxID=2727404 RepID=A0AAE1WA64_9LAMI|nr:Pentatricopeptide repeat-containing protein, mitochondrial [Sesamum angolense]